jgi:hypothetical protein
MSSDIFQSSIPRSRSLSVSPRTAGEMLEYGKTKIKDLIKNRELESYVDGGARRIVTQSIYDYVERRRAASEPARRGLDRPKKAKT